MERNTPQRNRQRPKRYGVAENEAYIPDQENCQDDDEDKMLQLYGDNSIDDKTYSPETPKTKARKIVATVGRVGNNSKKRVQFTDNLELDQIKITGMDFNSIYDEINENISIVSDPDISREKNQQNCSKNQGY